MAPLPRLRVRRGRMRPTITLPRGRELRPSPRPSSGQQLEGKTRRLTSPSTAAVMAARVVSATTTVLWRPRMGSPTCHRRRVRRSRRPRVASVVHWAWALLARSVAWCLFTPPRSPPSTPRATRRSGEAVAVAVAVAVERVGPWVVKSGSCR